MNLLPEKEKNALISDQKNKIITVIGLTALFSLIGISLILFSIQFSAMSKVAERETLLDNAMLANKSSEIQDAITTIKKHNLNIARIKSFNENEIYFSNALKTIMDVVDQKVVDISIIVISNKNDLLEIKITGDSKSRENLLLFKKKIDESQIIKNPAFSQESWVNPINPSFSLSFELQP